MRCALAATHHDPDGRLLDQLERALPALGRLFDGVAVQATDSTPARFLAPLHASGALVRSAPAGGHLMIGRARRGAVELALGLGAPLVMFCDLDRALHWAEQHPAELADVVGRLGERDFTVLGRTSRAFASHPRTQRDTESVVNTVFAQVSGRAWDVTAAARGLSRAAAEAIVSGCAEESVGTDTAWPVFAERRGLTLGYIEAEGLEFETPDRFPDEVAALGGAAAWVERLDRRVGEWTLRLEIARAEVAALEPYVEH